jgi:hypothetical protein
VADPDHVEARVAQRPDEPGGLGVVEHRDVTRRNEVEQRPELTVGDPSIDALLPRIERTSVAQ